MIYHYVGPPDLRRQNSPTRRRIREEKDVASWVAQTAQELDGAAQVTATFIVSVDGQLWIADRHSEHIACAAGASVLTAGEITFEFGLAKIEVAAITNQSTGFCPRPQSWPAVAQALDKAGLTHPGEFTTKFDFRRCDRCGEINVVKENWFVCALCDAELSRQWNLA